MSALAGLAWNSSRESTPPAKVSSIDADGITKYPCRLIRSDRYRVLNLASSDEHALKAPPNMPVAVEDGHYDNRLISQTGWNDVTTAYHREVIAVNTSTANSSTTKPTSPEYPALSPRCASCYRKTLATASTRRVRDAGGSPCRSTGRLTSGAVRSHRSPGLQARPTQYAALNWHLPRRSSSVRRCGTNQPRSILGDSPTGGSRRSSPTPDDAYWLRDRLFACPCRPATHRARAPRPRPGHSNRDRAAELP
jgi:hypothetical protein